MGWWRRAQQTDEDRRLDQLLKDKGARLRERQSTQKADERLRESTARRRAQADLLRQRAAKILAEPAETGPSGEIALWPHRHK